MTEKMQTIPYTSAAPHVTAHPHLLEAVKFKRNGKETGEAKFGAVFVIEPDHIDLVNLKAKAVEAARLRWPGVDLKTLQFPFKDGSAEADKRVAKLKAEGKEDDKKGDFQRGKVLLKASSKFQPKLSIWPKGAAAPIELTDEAAFKMHGGKFYFGVKALFEVAFQAYDPVREGDKPGVTAYLQQLCSTNEGDRLAGGRSASEVFSGYKGTVSGIDPTKAGDDEIPF